MPTLSVHHKHSSESNIVFKEIICGGVEGEQSLGEKYANEYNIPVQIYHPETDKYGEDAILKMNQEIIKNCDALTIDTVSRSKEKIPTINFAREMKKRIWNFEA